MGFGPPNNGNKVPASIPTVIGTTPAVTPIEDTPVKAPEEKLVDNKYVLDTFHNKTGVNVGRFPSVIADLKGWAEGTPQTVTYYKEHYAETDIKGRPNTEESISKVHASILKIFNFEMRFTTALQYTHDTDEAISKMSGEAYTYPGFEPELGDRFAYEVELGKFGLFQVIQQPTRMAIRSSTYFKINFELIEYFTEATRSEIEARVTDVAYFDKSRFLNEPGSLLYHDEVVEMKFMEIQRAKMIHYYQSKFLDEKIMYSFMRPDDVYDPYVTDFMMKILDFSELGTMAVQLHQDAPYMEDSIWRAILDPNLPLEAVPTSSKKSVYRLGSKSVLANSLINKYYVEWTESMSLADYLKQLAEQDSKDNDNGASEELTPDPTVPTLPDDEESDKLLGDLLLHIHPHYTECPLMDSDSELTGGIGDMFNYIFGDGDYFTLLSQFLLTRKIVTLATLHKLIEEVWKLPKIYQFYRMPFLIYMCDVVCKYIHHSENIFEP